MTACADCHFNTPDCSSSIGSNSGNGRSGSVSSSSSASINHQRWNRQAEKALRDKDKDKGWTSLGGGADNQNQQLFTTQITHFEIDVAYLHANQHFNSAQIWANLEKKYAPVNLMTGERNEKCMRGLFPRLVSLECNHWLPSPHFLRLLRGIPTSTPSTPTSSLLDAAQSSSLLPIRLSLSPGEHNGQI